MIADTKESYIIIRIPISYYSSLHGWNKSYLTEKKGEEMWLLAVNIWSAICPSVVTQKPELSLGPVTNWSIIQGACSSNSNKQYTALKL